MSDLQKRPDAAQILNNIQNAKAATAKGTKYSYTSRDLCLYALSVGAQRTDLRLVFEGHKAFVALPVFGLIPFFNAQAPYQMEDIVQNYDLRRLLHVDQYLEVRAAIPAAGTLTTLPKLLQVVDKGKDAMVIQGFDTQDEFGNTVFYNETTVLIRGSGGFNGQRDVVARGAATAKNEPPSRVADVIIEEKTYPDQAAIYRLNGDYNPLHIDPDFSSKGGFNVPILHGLCTIGIAGKHIFQTYGPFKNLKSRLVGVVIPGQTLQIQMWREQNKVIFQVTVVETAKLVLSAAAAELGDPSKFVASL